MILNVKNVTSHIKLVSVKIKITVNLVILNRIENYLKLIIPVSQLQDISRRIQKNQLLRNVMIIAKNV